MQGELPRALNDEELKCYFIQYRNGDRRARNKLIEHNMRLVLLIVSQKYRKTEYDVEMLLSIGFEALIKAVDGYDIDKDSKFSSYLSRCVTNNINLYIKRNQTLNNLLSLDEPVLEATKERHTLLGDLIADDIDIELEYDDKELMHILVILIGALEKDEKNILGMHYGFNGKAYSCSEIAKMYNTSCSTISRRISAIIRKIKKELVDLGILKFEDLNYDRIVKFKKCSFYEHFEGFTEEEIDSVLYKINDYERNLLVRRYGSDLKNPIFNNTWTIVEQKQFLALLAKIRKWLKKQSIDNSDNIKVKYKKRNSKVS